MKKLMIILLVGMLTLGLGTVAFATTTSDSTTVSTTIGEELVLDVSTPSISYTLNATTITTGDATIDLAVDTNANTYNVTAQVTTWDSTPYDAIFGSETPGWSYTTTSDDANTNDDTFSTSSATDVLSSATGEVNDENTTLTCLMAIDYTVPDASNASATITFTASASY